MPKTVRIVPILVVEEEGKAPLMAFQADFVKIELSVEMGYAHLEEDEEVKIADIRNALQSVDALENELLPPYEAKPFQEALLQARLLAEGLILTEKSLREIPAPNGELRTYHAVCAVTTGSLGTGGMKVYVAFSKEAMRENLSMFKENPRYEGVLRMAETVTLPMPEKKISLDDALESYQAHMIQKRR